jgi:hypothetical protein
MAERELSESPATLPLLAKAAAALVPGASRLPFVSGGGGELPPLTLVLAGVRVDRDRLAAACAGSRCATSFPRRSSTCWRSRFSWR